MSGEEKQEKSVARKENKKWKEQEIEVWRRKESKKYQQMSGN